MSVPTPSALDTAPAEAPTAEEASSTGPRRSLAARLVALPKPITTIVVLGLAVIVWYLVSLQISPLFLPGPDRVAAAIARLTVAGTLPVDIGVSFMRVLVGWLLGAAVAVPLGILAGRLQLVRVIVEPFIDFFRFIPPIAFLTLALIWLGLGEASKIGLIFYASLFIVFLNTMTGALSVDREKLEAAAMLGASRRQSLLTVVVPATIPSVITGLRVALGICFMTVVAAEFVAAESGVGFLIWNARLFARTDEVFVGIVALGVMGLVADMLFRLLLRKIAYRYQVKL